MKVVFFAIISLYRKSVQKFENIIKKIEKLFVLVSFTSSFTITKSEILNPVSYCYDNNCYVNNCYIELTLATLATGIDTLTTIINRSDRHNWKKSNKN